MKCVLTGCVLSAGPPALVLFGEALGSSWEKEVTGDMPWSWNLDPDTSLIFASWHLWYGYLLFHNVTTMIFCLTTGPESTVSRTMVRKAWDFEPKFHLCSFKVISQTFGSQLYKSNMSILYELFSLFFYSVFVKQKKNLLVKRFHQILAQIYQQRQVPS